MTTPLNVAIDGRALVGNRTGIGVHTAMIAGRLAVEPPPLIASHAAIGNRDGIEHCRFAVDSSPLGVLWQQSRFATRVEKERCDVVWGPHGTLPLSLTTPAVVSMHDLTSITMPHRHRIKTVLSFNTFVRASMEKARRIAAVSRHTADQLHAWFGIEQSKLAVVPNGVDPFFSPASARDPDLPQSLEPRSYILYAGTLEPRKGIGDLLDAWTALRAPRPPLVLAGDPGWGDRRIRVRVDNDDAIVRLGFVSREALRALLRHALVFVYPSHDEGFGLPVLEAMACGSPVVTTLGGAIPETAGGAALLVEPSDSAALRGAIQRLIDDDSLRSELIGQGLERARHFDWQTSADAMLTLLAEAAEGRR